MSDQQLAEELHKPIIKKFKKRKVKSHFIDNISGVDLAVMQLINKFTKEICSLLCVIDIFTNAFQKVLDETNRKPNKIQAD